jgi:predicted nucleic acid-binding Zn ribbon protein
MPLVDYKDCETGEIFEVLIKSGDIPQEIINEETGNKSERIFSGNIGFKFKGTGFYETDYKRKK